MYDRPESLLEKIRLGEDSTFELKSVRFKGSKPELSRDALADEIAAFANSSDGVIVFGVDDKSRHIEGMPLEGLDTLESMLSEVANDSIKPSPYLRMVKMTLPDATGHPVAILKLDIPRSLFVHMSPGGYFYRIGDKKREMSPEILARLFQQRSQVRIIRFDEQPVPSTSPSDLDENLWRRFAEGLEDSADVILDKLRLVTKDDAGEKRLSVAGVLLATKRPAAHIPTALIEAVAYRGMARDSNYQLDARTIEGPIDEQVREGIAFVRRNMRIGARKDPGRVDIPQFSIRAVFELLVNAVAHRDYSIHGSKIRLFLFEDRLELYSPGMIPNSMTLESMALRQSTRNELVTSLLSRCAVGLGEQAIGRQFMMDKRGEGIPIIIAETQRASGKKPEFKLIDDAELVITLPSAEAGAWGR